MTQHASDRAERRRAARPAGRRIARLERLLPRELLSANGWSFRSDEPIAFPMDVNGDGEITAVDALQVINRLQTGPPWESSGNAHDADGSSRYDVNSDGRVTSVDAVRLRVRSINGLSLNQIDSLRIRWGDGQNQSNADAVAIAWTKPGATSLSVLTDQDIRPVVPVVTSQATRSQTHESESLALGGELVVTRSDDPFL